MKKENSVSLHSEVCASAKTTKSSVWAIIAKVFNLIPYGICHCETENDAKVIVSLIIISLSAFIMAGIYDAMMKGGLL
ncbi:hypothetical protein [Parabacteroides leei]|uniref:hypothetical protein n=1 Tax=Parabacteroides leei TaxID=2939491 RepID=UPI001899791F|nr:hypothetical protein [Parabacteroides goldsteinii]